MLNGEPIGYAARCCFWKRGFMVEEETDPGVRGIDQVTGECITIKGLGTKLVRAWV